MICIGCTIIIYHVQNLSNLASFNETNILFRNKKLITYKNKNKIDGNKKILNVGSELLTKKKPTLIHIYGLSLSLFLSLFNSQRPGLSSVYRAIIP